MIKAPFNFVPLNESPYLPKWADQISQDIPFEDGLLGKLKLRINAETPIFVTTKCRRTILFRVSSVMFLTLKVTNTISYQELQSKESCAM